jgi:cobalt-zinc-cadmium efflux system membrane fusion protein
MQKNKQSIAIISVIIVAIILAVLILNSDKPKETEDEHKHAEEAVSTEVGARPAHGEPGHNHEKDHLALPVESSAPHDAHEHSAQAQEITKGPHGGKLFTQDGYGVEVTIFEQNVPPEFRVYTYQDGKALDPDTSVISIDLERLGGKSQLINFTKENDYLKGDAVVEEPHSFNVKITAKHNNKTHQFSYDQVESRVKMTDKQLTLNSIEVLTAGPANIKSVLQLQGEIKLNADKSVHVLMLGIR